MSLGQAALDLASSGFDVFAAHSRRDNGACTCTDRLCDNIAKHPRFFQKVKDQDTWGDLAHGRDSATTDPRLIATWWTRWPEANIGVATGDGLMVLDVDGPAGRETLERYAALPETLRARTGRPDGGEHWYFEVPEGVQVRNRAKKFGPERIVLPGLDVRGDGGYVIAPPSLHASGARYEWVDPAAEIAPCPLWLLELVRVREPEPVAAGPRNIIPVSRQAGELSAYARAALEGELERLLSAGEGTRNDTLNEVAFKLGTLVAGGELPDSLVRDEVWAVARGIGLGETETRRTIDSAMGAAARSPREVPERPQIVRTATMPAPEPEKASSNGSSPHVPYPIEVWPEQVAEFIEQTACSVCVAPEAVGTAVLAVAASAIGRARWFDVKGEGGWIERPGIYAGLVGDVSRRKSPALFPAADPLERIHVEQAKRWAHEHAEWEEAPKGKPEPELASPLMKDITTEVLAHALKAHPRGVGLVADELVGWLNGMGQYKGGKGNDRQRWLEAYQGRLIDVRRVGRKPIVVEHPCVSIVGGVQPAVFSGLSAVHDGLAERFLYCLLPKVHREARTPDVPRPVRGTWEGVVRALYGLTEAEVVCQVPDCLTDARQRVIDAGDEVPPTLEGYFGKGETHLVRIGIVLAAVWEVCGAGDRELTGTGVRRAEDLWSFYADQAQRLFSGDVIPVRAYVLPGPSTEGELAAWLRARGGTGTKREAMNRGPLRSLSAKGADEVIFAAAARGEIVVDSVVQERGGRTRVLLRLMD